MIENMIKKDNMYYVHSAKKFCELIPRIPEDAYFYTLHSCSIPDGMILEDPRKGYTLYHTHLKNGSNPKFHGKFGKHAVFRLDNDENGDKKNA